MKIMSVLSFSVEYHDYKCIYIFLDSDIYFVDLCFYLALVYSTCSSAM